MSSTLSLLIFKAFTNIPTVNECRHICEDNPSCSQYTYFEESHLTNLCLLFSSCDTLDEKCDGCVTGSPGCELCSFDNTVDGQCGKPFYHETLSIIYFQKHVMMIGRCSGTTVISFWTILDCNILTNLFAKKNVN